MAIALEVALLYTWAATVGAVSCSITQVYWPLITTSSRRVLLSQTLLDTVALLIVLFLFQLLLETCKVKRWHVLRLHHMASCGSLRQHAAVSRACTLTGIQHALHRLGSRITRSLWRNGTEAEEASLVQGRVLSWLSLLWPRSPSGLAP